MVHQDQFATIPHVQIHMSPSESPSAGIKAMRNSLYDIRLPYDKQSLCRGIKVAGVREFKEETDMTIKITTFIQSLALYEICNFVIKFWEQYEILTPNRMYKIVESMTNEE
ncbi:hypothetical protein TNCV_1763151 [Trichonephila clavipes]|nr:hypothetical protein TNCV_1763151 [Trichonephila clavipes]